MRALSLAALLAATACSSGSAPAPAPTKTAPAIAPVPAPVVAAAGTVRTEKLASASLGVDKSYVIYLPAGYETSGKRYPVFYYLHGLGGDETNWTDGGELDKAADALGLQAIVVMPDGDDAFYVNGTTPVDYDACIKDGTGMFMPGHEAKRTNCVRKRDYATYITKDLVAHVDATYRTIATREGRAIAGLSMGGFGALQLSMRNPELFAAAASHSGVVSLTYIGPHPYQSGKAELLTDPKMWGLPIVELRNWMLGVLSTDMARWRELDPTTLVNKLEPGKLALYIDCGTEDDFFLMSPAAYLHDLLLGRKIEHEFFLGPGHHNFNFWKARVPESLRFLRDHTTKPQ